MTVWTEKETQTLRQNMHFAPSGIVSILPGRSVKAIRNKRLALMKPDAFFKGVTNKSASKVSSSLSLRGWNALEITMYRRACQGDIHAVEELRQKGLWNMECKGVMS